MVLILHLPIINHPFHHHCHLNTTLTCMRIPIIFRLLRRLLSKSIHPHPAQVCITDEAANMVRQVVVEHVKQSTMPKRSSKSSKDGSKPGTVHILKFEVAVDDSQCFGRTFNSHVMVTSFKSLVTYRSPQIRHESTFP